MNEKEKKDSLEFDVEDRPNSVEISINAKGQFSGKVKVYAHTIEEAMIKGKKHAEELEKYVKFKND